MVVKLGICVAYDWQFLQYSLPAIYNYVDAICLSIDAYRKSWNGNLFEIDSEGLRSLVQTLDVHKKIRIFEESFYNTDRTPIENESYQRKRMAEVLGKADWIVQIDTDEIFVNPSAFIGELKKKSNNHRPLNIHGIWINLIKQTENGFIYSILKTPPLATNLPVYEYGRTNGHFNIYTNSFIAHITWARPAEEVKYKLENWGHSHEFNGLSFLKIWQALDDDNWRYIRDFHPMSKVKIEKLYFKKASDLESFIRAFDMIPHNLKPMDMLSNNIWASRVKKLIKKMR